MASMWDDMASVLLDTGTKRSRREGDRPHRLAPRRAARSMRAELVHPEATARAPHVGDDAAGCDVRRHNTFAPGTRPDTLPTPAGPPHRERGWHARSVRQVRSRHVSSHST
jgi:hypothetical protein